MAETPVVCVKSVLVADDTAFVRDRFRDALRSGGHRAILACSRTELLHAMRDPAARPDLIALDLRLSAGHGVALVRQIQALPDPPPIVVFSGTIATREEASALTGMGVAGYINEYLGAHHILPALAPYLFPEHYRRRASPRVQFAASLVCRVGNTVASGLTRNISSGGLAVRTTNAVTSSDVLRVRFRLPGTGEIDAEARVAWQTPGIGMGLQFTHIGDRERDAVAAWVLGHFFTNRKG